MTEIVEKAREIAQEGAGLWGQGLGQRALSFYAKAHGMVDGQDDIPLAERLGFGADYALVLAMTGHTDKAMVLWHQLLAEAEANDLPTERILRQMAVTHELRRELPQAAALLDRIKPGLNSSDDARLKWHNAYGIIAWRQGQRDKAQRHFELATNALPSDPASAGMVRAVLSNAAILEYEMHRIDSGHAYAERMQAIADPAQTFATQRGLFRLRAIRAQLQDEGAKAAALWSEAFELVLTQTPHAHDYQLEFATLAALGWRDLGKPAKARRILDTAIDNCPKDQRHLATTALIASAELLLDAGDWAEAKVLLDEVVLIEASRNDTEREVPLLAALARVAQQMGQVEAAIVLGKMSLSKLLHCGLSLDFDDVAAMLQQSKRTALDLTDTLNRQARYAEAGAIRQLYARHVQTPGLQRSWRNDALTPEIPFRDTEMAIAAPWTERHAHVTTNDAALNKAPDSSQEAKGAAGIAQILAFAPVALEKETADLPMAAPPGVLRIIFSVGSATICFKAVRDGQIKEGRLAQSPGEVAILIANLRDNISDIDRWRPIARQLYRILIKPVHALVEGAERIEVATSGMLEQLPFACLEGGGQFLCEYAPVVFVRQADDHKAAPRETHLIAFAGQDGSGIAPLASVGPEAQDIIEQAPSATFVPPDHFTRDALLLHLQSRPSHLHFGGHFELVPAKPHLSRLVLGNGDGLHLSEFTAPEFDMSGVKLACFAACQTGMVEQGADGFESLAQVILDQGAEHVVATLWPVLDTDAHRITVAFYARLFGAAQGDVTKALGSVQKQAAARLRRTHDQGDGPQNVGGIGGGPIGLPPSDWAGFALYSRI